MMYTCLRCILYCAVLCRAMSGNAQLMTTVSTCWSIAWLQASTLQLSKPRSLMKGLTAGSALHQILQFVSHEQAVIMLVEFLVDINAKNSRKCSTWVGDWDDRRVNCQRHDDNDKDNNNDVINGGDDKSSNDDDDDDNDKYDIVDDDDDIDDIDDDDDDNDDNNKMMMMMILISAKPYGVSAKPYGAVGKLIKRFDCRHHHHGGHAISKPLWGLPGSMHNMPFSKTYTVWLSWWWYIPGDTPFNGLCTHQLVASTSNATTWLFYLPAVTMLMYGWW